MANNLPHSSDALRQHNAAVGRPGAKIPNRIDYIREACRGKRVRDIGIVDHDKAASETEGWLHKHISDAASHSLGIDILEDDISALQRRGFNVRVHDLCDSPVNETFDVIVMGELMQHVNSRVVG